MIRHAGREAVREVFVQPLTVLEEAAAPVPLADLHSDFRTLASGVDARFMHAGSALAQAYEIVERLIGSLEGIANALDREDAEAAIGNMRSTADRLASLPALQQERQRDMIAIGQAGKALRDQIAQIHRSLQFLRICGLNIKVAAAGAEEFSGFADTMFLRLDLGEAQLASFEQGIEQLAGKVASMIEAEQRLASECALVVPLVPIRLAEDAVALQQHQTETAERASQVADVARTIRVKLAAALGALQIGDITRQRLEHVADGFLLLEAFLEERAGSEGEGDRAIGEAVRRRTLALLAAQAADAIADFRRDARLLTGSLREIAPDADRLLALRPDGGAAQDSDGHSFLHKLENGIAEIANVTGRLRAADEQSDRLGNATSDIAEGLSRRLEAVRKVQSDVEQMAWNTSLRCRRMGEDGLALAVIAGEIRQFSNTLQIVSEHVTRTFDQLTAAAISIRGQRDEVRMDAGRALVESLASIRSGGERTRASLASLDGDASAVAAILRDSTDQIDCDAAMGTVLEAASMRLAAIVPPDEDLPESAAAPLAAMLAILHRSYTMAREREVHRGFAIDASDGTGEAETEAVPAEFDDDALFDDALF